MLINDLNVLLSVFSTFKYAFGPTAPCVTSRLITAPSLNNTKLSYDKWIFAIIHQKPTGKQHFVDIGPSQKSFAQRRRIQITAWLMKNFVIFHQKFVEKQLCLDEDNPGG